MFGLQPFNRKFWPHFVLQPCCFSTNYFSTNINFHILPRSVTMHCFRKNKSTRAEYILLKLILKNFMKNFRVTPFHLRRINCTSNAHLTGICIYMRYRACENSHPCSPRISKHKQFLWRSTVALGLGYGDIRDHLQNWICRWHDAQYQLHYAYIPVSLLRTEIMLTILKDILGFCQLTCGPNTEHSKAFIKIHQGMSTQS